MDDDKGMKTVGIIQARVGSTRLPYKMLLSLHGKPIIEWVVRRVQKSKLLDEIIVAIPNTSENDILEKYCKGYDVIVYRGSEDDVLDRFYQASKLVNIDSIVRICADNPLISPEEIDTLIEFFIDNKCDYAYNHIPNNNEYPDGLGAEIISNKTLSLIHDKAKIKAHREHCFSYIIENPNMFIIKTFSPESVDMWHPELKFDVDNFQDYEYLHLRKFSIEINARDIVKLYLNL